MQRDEIDAEERRRRREEMLARRAQSQSLPPDNPDNPPDPSEAPPKNNWITNPRARNPETPPPDETPAPRREPLKVGAPLAYKPQEDAQLLINQFKEAAAQTNQAKWIGTTENISEQLMQMGYPLQDIERMYFDAVGEPYPRSLHNSILAKNQLFPGADMLFEYDLDHHMKRSYPHRNADYPQGTGYGDWVAMDPAEVTAVNQYFDWRNNPANEWMINQANGNPYQAWLMRSGDRFKTPYWDPAKGASRTPFNTTAPVAPTTPTFPDQPTATSGFGTPPAPVNPTAPPKTSVQALTNSLTTSPGLPPGFGTGVSAYNPGQLTPGTPTTATPSAPKIRGGGTAPPLFSQEGQDFQNTRPPGKTVRSGLLPTPMPPVIYPGGGKTRPAGF